ncbi:MAG: aminodeoxychorismate/anthranilate synthase component II, partial [Oscillospiraceae bacterium]|nr:aminodeoxychorismate/anthranilate synthase component II [Oscillospiraceae bacterium]
MTLLIDNYDSFSYNLYQMIGALDPDIRVVRNDALTVGEIEALRPARVVLSPGPGRPEDAGVCVEAVRLLAGRVPILGVCLGHQAICVASGAVVSYAKTLMHGKPSRIALAEGCPLFRGLPRVIEGGRYHSLAVRPETLPAALDAVARADDGEVMAVWRRGCETYGLQFHPESILTPEGRAILANFIERR